MSNYNTEELKVGYTNEFVIQEHKSRHLHWDLRLGFPVQSAAESLKQYSEKRSNSPEPNANLNNKSVLRSWAIPKHTLPEEKALLAIEVEDHDFEYRFFKGTIPEGHYGAGTVEIYDSGTFTLINVIHDKKYTFILNGKKIQSTFTLFKIADKKYLWTRKKD